ncbi:MAG TPA: RNA polymerase sigma factor RpoH [Rhodospirillaceae bacterium]|nr:MAG: RNA polymerase factor sigma-32 [Alphaproteobacteria bacterium GWF2_58_20]HAU29033.1 RNA polymerase sigma factor RpoH [Rhodospirillaceae bacterium]
MTNNKRTLPAVVHDDGLQKYLQEIRQFPMLTAEEEYTLGKRWQDEGDTEAAHALVTSHLRLVAKVAATYRGYGLPMGELIAEGNIGLMHAVKKYDPDRGFRLATYAIWWIKASIQDFVLRSWSLVKIGTTAAQKRLFFNLGKVKRTLDAIDSGQLTPEQVTYVARQLNVTEDEVVSMNMRLSASDKSLNARRSSDDDGEWQDWLADSTPNQEILLAERQEDALRSRQLETALSTLNTRERDILMARNLEETPITLEELSQRHGISRERVRQIEVRALEKLRAAMTPPVKGA